MENTLSINTNVINISVVKYLLSTKYKNIKFLSYYSNNKYNTIAMLNGCQKNIFVKRNSYKYKDSNYFSLMLNKNKLQQFSNSLYTFIDDQTDSLYLVNGNSLLAYIVDNDDKLQSIQNTNKFKLLLPKSDIVTLANNIIKYNRQVASILELYFTSFNS